MRQLYSWLMYLITPYLLVRLWWKSRRSPAYWQRVGERFSLDKLKLPGIDIWLHAVSVGEVVAIIPLVDALLAEQKQILITTMTPTGAERVQRHFGNRVNHRYVPYDLPWVVRRFFKKIKPRLGLIVETELWPNLIHYATKEQIPLFLINARLSPGSYQGYRKLRYLLSPLLQQFKTIFAQTEYDAQRFKALGAKAEKVIVLGNLKFDLQTQTIDSDFFKKLKNHWGSQRPVVIAASTHDGEEAQLLSCLKILQQGLPHVILLLAPRHPERFQMVYQFSIAHGFNTGLRSKQESLTPENEVVVLDSLGELLGFYQISDYAFVGGSLVPIGGHNVLEPIAMQVPVFSGSYVHNFQAICADLQAAEAIEFVENAADLVNKIIAMQQNPERKMKRVVNATSVLQANKGVVQRLLTLLVAET